MAYDYGKGNQEHYGQDTPPKYDTTSLVVPKALYWSQNDMVAQPEVSRVLFKMIRMLKKKYKSVPIILKMFNSVEAIWKNQMSSV